MRVRIAAMVAAGLTTMSMGAAEAQQDPAGKPVTELDTITITADRVPSTIYNSPATVSVKDAQEIDRQIINGPRDLVRDEPGVSITNAPTRTGPGNFVIRGIGENRVRLQIDGVKIPDYPQTNFGPGLYTRDIIDYDSLKQVEIIRGPASALYGSDAIGGVVSFLTKDPSDYLGPDKNFFGSLKGGYDSVDRSFMSTATIAGRQGPFEAMLLYTKRIGHETDANGALKPNPVDYFGDNILGKIIYNHPDLGQFKVTLEYLRKNSNVDVITARTNPAVGTRVLSSLTDDLSVRKRVSLDWTAPVETWFADTVKTTLYATQFNRTEFTTDLRGPAGSLIPNARRVSDFGFDQTIIGAEIQLTALRQFWGGEHLFTYGGTLDQTKSSRPRDRFEENLITGAITKTFAGEVFPNKNFPDTETTQAAAYIQDIATYGRWRFIPAIRFDYYHLTPKPDAAFANSNTGGFPISERTETEISPKFGVTYDINENFRLFGQYAHGFRAPPYDNANFGFRNPLQGYEILPNGNLKPETSDGIEAGIRGKFDDGSSFQVSAFYNRYKDFIDTVLLSAPPVTPLMRFQYQNLSNVTIWGAEAKGEWRLNPTWALFGTLAYARGEDNDTRLPVDSVDPFTAVAGVRYRNEGWNAEVRARYIASKTRVSNASYVKPGASTVVDALVSYEVSQNLVINAGIFNIFNESYFNPQDVRAIAATTPTLELYRAPGRSFAMNMTVKW